MRSVSSDVNILIDKDKCYACGSCVERCIMDNLRMKLSPCRDACPIHMNCQGYIRLIAQGNEEQAAREMRKDLPFAGIIGRICHRPCEDRCERRKVDGQPVHIRALKRYLADTLPEIAQESEPVAGKSGKRVAIVGSGPAGLMAAYDLTVKGHAVTVFEAASEPGGMLRWAIPAFRLPLSELTYAIRMLEKMEVVFKTGFALGKEIELEELSREWDSVLLATGGGNAAKLGIPGEDSPGVYQGIDLLRIVREGKNIDIGKTVVVIGGGNTAIDAALTCRKLGAEEVSLICLEKSTQMPAFPAEIEEALEEGIKIQDCWGPKRILKKDHRVLTVELSHCIRVYDEKGGFCPELEDTCGLSPSAESVVVAIGQKPDFSEYPEALRSSNQRLSADPLTLQTIWPNVFAAGDVATGPKSAIQAMAQGREAAVSIDRALMGETLRWGRAYWGGAYFTEFSIDRSRAVDRSQAILSRTPIRERTIAREVEKTMDKKTAREEAERCLNCGSPAEINQTCWYCLPCEIECPVGALEVRMPYLVR